MASIRKEIQVRRTREAVWDAVRDVGSIHKRLVPGFVVDCEWSCGNSGEVVRTALLNCASGGFHATMQPSRREPGST